MAINPIRHLVILCHPKPGSFNHQVAETYLRTAQACGQEVEVRDLYALEFDPVLGQVGEMPEADLLDDIAELRRCDVLAFVYPMWFGQPPAMVKGYIDRVLGAGFLPQPGKLRSDSLALEGKRMLTISTSGSSEVWLAEQGQLTALHETVDRYLGAIFRMARTERLHLPSIVPGMTSLHAREQLQRVQDVVRSTCADVLHAAHRREICAMTGIRDKSPSEG